MSSLNDLRTTQLANRILPRILWHMAEECGDYDAVVAKIGHPELPHNELNIYSAIAFKELLCLEAEDIQVSLKPTIDSLVTEFSGGDILDMKPTRMLGLSRDIAFYFREIGYLISSKPIYEIIQQELQQMQQTRPELLAAR